MDIKFDRLTKGRAVLYNKAGVTIDIDECILQAILFAIMDGCEELELVIRNEANYVLTKKNIIDFVKTHCVVDD